MIERPSDRVDETWAKFRFMVIGPLLASPPKKGKLGAAIVELAERTWGHPVYIKRRFALPSLPLSAGTIQPKGEKLNSPC